MIALPSLLCLVRQVVDELNAELEALFGGGPMRPPVSTPARAPVSSTLPPRRADFKGVVLAQESEMHGSYGGFGDGDGLPSQHESFSAFLEQQQALQHSIPRGGATADVQTEPMWLQEGPSASPPSSSSPSDHKAMEAAAEKGVSDVDAKNVSVHVHIHHHHHHWHHTAGNTGKKS